MLWVGSSAVPGGVVGVDAAGAYGDSPQKPFATMEYATNQCSDNRGDVVEVLPNHTETIDAASDLNLDVAGVHYYGLGYGSTRPTINYTTAVGADMNVGAADVMMTNFLFTGGVDALTGPIDVNAADFHLLNCEWRDVTGQATDVIVADANADRMLIDGLRFDGAAAAGANSAIALIGCDRVTIKNSIFDGNFAVGAIDVRTTAATDLEVHHCRCRNRHSVDIFLIDTVTGSTGMIGPNIYIRIADNAANITEAITGATFVYFDDIYIVNLAGEKALLTNKTASTDA